MTLLHANNFAPERNVFFRKLTQLHIIDLRN